MKDLTLRQQEILNFIRDTFKRSNFWPSIREIQFYFGFRSTNAVMGHLKALERKGYISRVPGQARAFRVNFTSDEDTFDSDTDILDIPIYGSIAAGYPDGVEPGGQIGRLQIDTVTVGIRRSRKTFALKVRGESMINAGIFDGDIVIVEPGIPRQNDIVAALIDGETTLKRFVQRENQPPYLKAENPNYPELHPVSELVIQGIVKAVVRCLN